MIGKNLEKFKSIYRKYYYIFTALIVVLLFFVPRIFSKSTMTIVCTMCGYFIIAGALNVINGYCGQMCFGIAGFYCVGAYTMAILMQTYHVNYFLALIPAGLAAALMGAIVALPALRMRGMFLAMITIGFSEVMRLVALNWTEVTGGALGIKGITSPSVFGNRLSGASKYYYIYIIIVLIFLFCTRRVMKSRVGRAWLSIREDEMAAKSLGVEIKRYKIYNFMYGAFWAGIAGALLPPYTRYIDSTYFTLDEGFNILAMLVIGGQGTLAGPFVGVGVYQMIVETLRPIGVWRFVACAVLIIAMMWIRPQGLVGASNSKLAGSKRRSGLDFFKKFLKAPVKDAAESTEADSDQKEQERGDA